MSSPKMTEALKALRAKCRIKIPIDLFNGNGRHLHAALIFSCPFRRVLILLDFKSDIGVCLFDTL